MPLSDLPDEALLAEHKKLKKSRLMHAALIGFLAGIALFGIGAWLLSPNRSFAFLMPLLIPFLLIRTLRKSTPANPELEAELKKRSLA